MNPQVETNRRNLPCPCPGCDESGRVPTHAGELGRSCFQAALVVLERRRANGGEWTAGDLDYYAGATVPERRSVMSRRLTLGVIEGAQALAVADQLLAMTPRARMGGGKR